MAEQLFSPQCFICSWAPAHFFTPKNEPEPDLSWNQPRLSEECQESEFSAFCSSPSFAIPDPITQRWPSRRANKSPLVRYYPMFLITTHVEMKTNNVSHP